MIALSFAPNSSYIKKKRHLDPNDRKELRGFIIFRAAIRNCELIPHFPFKTYLDISLRRVSIIAIGHFSSFLRIWYQWKGLKINLVSLFNFLCILQTYHPMVRHFILGSRAAKSYGWNRYNISPNVDEEDKEQGNGTPGWKLIVTSWKSQAIAFPEKQSSWKNHNQHSCYLIGWNILWWRICACVWRLWTTPLELSFLAFFRSMFWMKEAFTVVVLAMF